MNIFKWIGKKLNPRQRLAILVYTIIDYVNERFAINFEMWFVPEEGSAMPRIKGRIWFVDVKPGDPTTDLNTVAEAD